MTIQPQAQGHVLDYHGVKVLVTGADGFIGSHLTESLVENGAEVTALCLYNSFGSNGWIDDLPAATRSRLEIVRGDVRDAAFTHRLVEVQDIVFHLAALIAIPHSYVTAQSYVETNVLGTLHVLEAARESRVKRVVVTSTSEVYGSAMTLPIDETHPLHAQSPYAATKIGADMLAAAFARSFDLPVALLRPFNTFGPRQSERAIIPTIIRQALDPACRREGCAVTIATAKRTTRMDFGIIEDVDGKVVGFREKPNITNLVSMGVYCMEPGVLDYVPPGVPFGFDDLVFCMLERHLPVGTFLHSGLWLDVGRVEDFQKAQELAWDESSPAFDELSAEALSRAMRVAPAALPTPVLA